MAGLNGTVYCGECGKAMIAGRDADWPGYRGRDGVVRCSECTPRYAEEDIDCCEEES